MTAITLSTMMEATGDGSRLGRGGHRRHGCPIVYLTKSFNSNIESSLPLIFQFLLGTFAGSEAKPIVPPGVNLNA
jgi:hypothetical protein